jgi:hypothetical protein
VASHPRVWRAIVLCLAPALERDDDLSRAAKQRAQSEGGRFADALREARLLMRPEE